MNFFFDKVVFNYLRYCSGDPSDVRLGFHSLTDQHSGIIVAIKTMTRHPDFTPPAMYSDIALIELKSTVTFGDSIRPACLYQEFDNVPIAAWVTGWGATEFGKKFSCNNINF